MGYLLGDYGTAGGRWLTGFAVVIISLIVIMNYWIKQQIDSTGELSVRPARLITPEILPQKFTVSLPTVTEDQTELSKKLSLLGKAVSEASDEKSSPQDVVYESPLKEELLDQ